MAAVIMAYPQDPPLSRDVGAPSPIELLVRSRKTVADHTHIWVEFTTDTPGIGWCFLNDATVIPGFRRFQAKAGRALRASLREARTNAHGIDGLYRP